ncbi:S-methyl-5-thioribose kinase [Peptoanaerobacter stomatis]|uniref:S-methyl-5-thioribose kinase n=1 Tax=Peptoanaerobacter stomatis TaxID=796937 RepID=G9XGB4_9FIRM|nr:S-methyl-5-thioribose kinase [Peptoanaerobacter stomatis]EHL15228.1 5-methylthioribose kinase [Peptoanaerobacter stomatis]
MYDKHFLLDDKSAIDYIRYKSDFFGADEKLVCKEIGDGNINYVFKIIGQNKSVVLKQADVLLRSSKRPLDINRIYIESEVLKIQSSYSKSVPEIYFYDDIMHIIAMEDISSYKNMRLELLNGRIFPDFADQITDFLVDTLVPTTDLIMKSEEKKKDVQKFINIEMCDISEDLVFTEPYYDYKNRNVILEKNRDFVQKNIYDNERLHFKVAMMRNNFMNNAQALIHGDLHTGSIFINEGGIKIIDPEFAFYGPMAYDIGNVIGNLYFAMYYNEIVSNNKQMYEYLQRSIYNIIVFIKKKMEKKLRSLIQLPIYNDEFIRNYVDRTISDSLRYAGTEMIRRVVGDSKVLEITSVKDIDKRVDLERSILNRALMLIC